MPKTIRLLAALLGIQVALAIGLHFTGPDLAAKPSDASLLSFTVDDVDSLTIESPGEPKIVLAKAGGNWQLADRAFPTEGDKATQMLKRLAELKRGQSMATTKGAHTRFKVSADSFERRVTLLAKGKVVGTLVLGTSANANQTYARAGDEDEVYTVALATYEVPSKADEWENKSLLQLPKDQIQAIDVAGLRLEQTVSAAGKTDSGAAKPSTSSTWHAASGLTGNQHLKAEAADKLAGLLADLRVGTVLGRESKSEYGLDKPVLQLSLTRKGGKPVEYRIGKTAETEEYTLQTSARPEYFRLYGYVARPLVDGATRDSLVGAP